jgi:hypothetical protein
LKSVLMTTPHLGVKEHALKLKVSDPYLCQRHKSSKHHLLVETSPLRTSFSVVNGAVKWQRVFFCGVGSLMRRWCPSALLKCRHL